MLAAAIAYKGSESNIEPGLQLFTKLAQQKRLSLANPTIQTLEKGEVEVGVVWDFNGLSYREQIDPKRFEVLIPADGSVISGYTTVINKYAKHPNAAKLTREYIFSDAGQINLAKGHARPIRAEHMKLPEDVQAKLLPNEQYSAAQPIKNAEAWGNDLEEAAAIVAGAGDHRDGMKKLSKLQAASKWKPVSAMPASSCSLQLSAFSFQLSAFSFQLSARTACSSLGATMQHNVILVLLDGLNYQVAHHAMGHLHAYVEADRAALYRVECELPSLSRPLYECILTGVAPIDSGIVHNGVNRLSNQRSVFHYAREANLGTAAAAYHWMSELYNRSPFDPQRDRHTHAPKLPIQHGLFYWDDRYPDSPAGRRRVPAPAARPELSAVAPHEHR